MVFQLFKNRLNIKGEQEPTGFRGVSPLTRVSNSMVNNAKARWIFRNRGEPIVGRKYGKKF